MYPRGYPCDSENTFLLTQKIKFPVSEKKSFGVLFESRTEPKNLELAKRLSRMTFLFNRLFNQLHDDFLIHDLSRIWIYFALTDQTFSALNDFWIFFYRLNVKNYEE